MINKLLTTVVIFFLSCGNTNTSIDVEKKYSTTKVNLIDTNQDVTPDTFSRDDSFQALRQKVTAKTPLVVHVMVPLCDNENQGIVPVPAKLGNGLDPKNNLYWGALYGVKTHLKRSDNWELKATINQPADQILERVIFQSQATNQPKVILVANAYRGDKMKGCISDYMNSISGNHTDSIAVDSTYYKTGQHADLIIFNGHNGLMDTHLDLIPSHDLVVRETAVIGCVSHQYFKSHLESSRGYPVLMTTNLMAPEAYVLEALVTSWAQLKNETDIKQSVGESYNKYQKCGLKGALNLFRYGW